jgi:hypothetical protein
MAKRTNRRQVAKKNRASLAAASLFASTGLLTGYLPYIPRASAVNGSKSVLTEDGCTFNVGLSGSSDYPVGDVEAYINNGLYNVFSTGDSAEGPNCSSVTINFTYKDSDGNSSGVVRLEEDLNIFTYLTYVATGSFIGDLVLNFSAGLTLDGSIYGLYYSYPTTGISVNIGSEDSASNVEINNLNLQSSSGLKFKGSSLTINNSDFISTGGNSIEIPTQNRAVNVLISNSQFGERGIYTSNYSGRGIYIQNDYSKVTVTDSKFYGNLSSYSGGAIHLSGYETSLVIDRSIFDSNQTDYRGGAVYLSGGLIGGGAEDASLTVRNSKFVGNVVQYGSGGAVSTSGVTLSEFYGNEFGNNSASNYGGGAIATYGSGSQKIINNTFWGNRAYRGTAIYSNLYFEPTSSPFRSTFSLVHNTFDNSFVYYSPSVEIRQSSNVTGPVTAIDGMYIIGNVFNHPLNRFGNSVPRQLEIELSSSLVFDTTVMYNISSGVEDPSIWAKDRGPDGQGTNLDKVPNLFRGDLRIQENLTPVSGSEAQSFVKWNNLSATEKLLFPSRDKAGRSRSMSSADAGALSISVLSSSTGGIGGGGGGFVGPITTESTSKVLPSFEPGSYKLNRKVRNSLKRLMLANLDARTVTCEVRVGKNFTKDQRKLARAQARAVCVLIEKRYPWVKAEEIKLTFIKRSDPNVGRARITLG